MLPRKRTTVLAASFLALGSATSAIAQDGAMWADAYGRVMSLQFGGTGAAPAAVDRSPEVMANLFERACVATNNQSSGVAAALGKGDPVFQASPVTVPGSNKTGPIVLEVWNAAGVTVSRTDGFFAAPNAQCNATFYVNAVPDSTALESALTTTLGAAPTNAADATKKNGQPNRGYAPTWAAAGDYIIEAHVSRANRYMPGNRVQLVMRAKAKSRS